VFLSARTVPTRVSEGNARNASKFGPKTKEVEGCWGNYVGLMNTLIIHSLCSLPVKPTFLIVKVIKY